MASELTVALEIIGRRGQQEFVLHILRADTRRYARLLVTLLDPIRQPLEVAVAV